MSLEYKLIQGMVVSLGRVDEENCFIYYFLNIFSYIYIFDDLLCVKRSYECITFMSVREKIVHLSI